MLTCSTPFKCFENSPCKSLKDFIKIKCSNKHCSSEKFMHLNCFNLWEENVIKQIHNYAKYMPKEFIAQNLWNPQHFNLNIPICQCKCRFGHLRIDDEYVNNYFERNRKESGSSFSTSSIDENNISPNGFNNLPLKPIKYKGKTNNNFYHYSSDSIDDSTSGISSLKTDNRTSVYIPSDNENFDISLDFNTYKSTALCPNSGLPLIAPLGCKFKSREDFTCFNSLPRSLINSLHIKMEDDGPHGNDETRFNLLSKFSSMNLTMIPCIFCNTNMEIFDRYPLINGIFFLSPLNYYNSKVYESNKSPYKTPINAAKCLINKNNYLEIIFKEEFLKSNSNNPNVLSKSSPYIQPHTSNKDNDKVNFKQNLPSSHYLNAICMQCCTSMHLYELIKKEWNKIQSEPHLATTLKELFDQDESVTKSSAFLDIYHKLIICSFCQKPWDGSRHTIGNLYSYDIFNSMPCCRDRLSCKSCCNIILPSAVFGHPATPFCSVNYPLVQQVDTRRFPFQERPSNGQNPLLQTNQLVNREILDSLNNWNPFSSCNYYNTPSSPTCNNRYEIWSSGASDINNTDTWAQGLSCGSSSFSPAISNLWSAQRDVTLPQPSNNQMQQSRATLPSADFFSNYSRRFQCPYCGTIDFHYVKKDRHDVTKVEIPGQIVWSLLLN